MKETMLNDKYSQTIAVNLLVEALESEGCQLAEIGLENLLIKVHAPDEVTGDCASAVAEILEKTDIISGLLKS